MIGLLSGAVAICSGAAIVNPLAAFVIGIVSGVITTYVYGVLEYKLHIDDALCVFPVHGACGLWGVIATGIFGVKILGAHPIYGFNTFGWGIGDWGYELVVQIVGGLVIFAVVAVLGYALFKILDMCHILRAKKDQELFGLDISVHKTFAYPEEEADKPFFR